jgi:pectinacetylesterase
MPIPSARLLAFAGMLLALAACGGGSSPPDPVVPGPYDGAPPLGAAIAQADAAPIPNAGDWTWVPFPDTTCTDAVLDSGAYLFSTSPTGLAISWGDPGNADVVVFLQGGGACWDFFTCGGAPTFVPKTAATGPFGPAEFEADIYQAYPLSWIRRENLPQSLAGATIVFVPYCTGDVHAGDAVTTYSFPGAQPITWHHAGHANVLAFLKRLGATFPAPRKLVVAGSSAGGFGALANYPAFRWYWPDAVSYLVDDSGPPLAGAAIPASTRAAWYASWDMGASLDAFCPSCQTDFSQGLRALAARYPQDRIALLSHLQDLTIREFFGTFTITPPYLVPMSAPDFEAALRALGTDAMDPATSNAKYFFTAGAEHPTLLDPTAIDLPVPLEVWIEDMLSDAPGWTSQAP